MSFEELLFWALVLYWVWVFLFRGRQRAPQEAPAPQAPRRRHAEAVEEALQEIRRALAELTLEAEPAPSLPAPTAERVEERFRWTEGAIQEASFERGRFFDSEPPPEKGSAICRTPPPLASEPATSALAGGDPPVGPLVPRGVGAAARSAPLAPPLGPLGT